VAVHFPGVVAFSRRRWLAGAVALCGVFGLALRRVRYGSDQGFAGTWETWLSLVTMLILTGLVLEREPEVLEDLQAPRDVAEIALALRRGTLSPPGRLDAGKIEVCENDEAARVAAREIA
jgi:hypothetical protein